MKKNSQIKKISFMETTTKTLTTTKWTLDPTHSELAFKIRHMMITNVKGEFRKFDATIVTDGSGFTEASVSATVDASSIFTNDETRDGHLKSADFFDVEKHPLLSFSGTDFYRIKGDEYKLKGILTIKEMSNEVELDVVFGGTNKDPWGNEKIGFSVEGKINRKDFGLSWNTVLETGGVLVGEEVRISGEFQFVRQI
jgi:polyisoprenoid-binding protein YceI